jgi:anti-anti-sigma regulatory factor
MAAPMSAAPTTLLDAPGTASATVAMATFDADLVCTYANPAFADVAGRDVESPAGEAWAGLFPGLAPSQQAVVAAVATDGPAVGEIDITPASTGRPDPAGPDGRRRWRLVLHRVEGIAGVSGGRVVSVLGTLAAGPAVLDPPAFRHRLTDTLQAGTGTPGLLLVDLGPQRPGALAGRAAALRGVVRTTDVVSLDDDALTGRSYLALLCPELPAPWTAAVVGDRLRRSAPLTEGLPGAEPPQVSVTVARPEDSAESLLRRASGSLQTELHVPQTASALRTTVREHTVRTGQAVVVRLTGEADLSTLRGLVTLLEAIAEDRPAAIVIDATHLAFCNMATARALVGATERAAGVGSIVGVAGMPATMERVFTLGWSAVPMRRWASVEVALASL